MEQLLIKSLRKKSADDALIPLINIVFLLLIFFMVAGSIQPSVPVDVDHPIASNIDNPIKALPVQILLTKNNEIYWNNKQISLTELQQVLTQQVPNNINLHIDQQVTAIDLDTVLNVIRQHQVQGINLITQQSMAN
ncbi:MAG: biopolymer transporter ExbD [Colwellia sp.]|nr:biopolymer transporter ExbD [Colwellia sp.]